jgi:Amt family ammonium transporter
MDVAAQIQNLWLLTCTALVFIMQAGFCCLEAGSVRSKNSINVALKNVLDFLVASLCFYGVGYSLMWGRPWFEGIAGRPVPLLQGIAARETFPFLYQLVFCGTAATIVSGAMAERLRFLPYILGSAGLSLIIYPLYGYWVWNPDGFLNGMGFHDFAGSSVVHMVGGIVALAGVHKIGARRGRFDAAGRPRSFPASNVPMVALGTFILFFGWIGFNGGSAPFGEKTGFIVLNTLLGGVFGGITCLLLGWALQGVSGAGSTLNGVLAGLVAITAAADVVSPPAAALIGGIGGAVFLLADRLLLRLRLDDAVGAVAVHFGAGLAGIVLTGFFAGQGYLDETAARLGTEFTRTGLIKVQLIGAGACILWTYLAAVLLWELTGRAAPLRVSEDEEAVGLNYSEHQVANPADEIVAWLRERSEGGAAARPLDLDGGEHGRLLAAVDGWAARIERERAEIDRIRGWLDKDADRMNALIERCHEGNRRQAERLMAVAERVHRVEADLRHRALPGGLPSPLAADVLEGVAATLAEMRAAGDELAWHWDQLRNLGSSLLRTARAPTGKAA